MKSRSWIYYCILAVVIVPFLCIFILYLALLLGAPIEIETKEYKAELYIDGVCLTRYLGDDLEVIIPDSFLMLPVYSIGPHCFFDNDNIETVRVSDNVKYIESEAFFSCKKLKSIEANNVVKVGFKAFSHDSKLENVKLGDKLYVIGWNAFEGCTALSYIPSKNSLREIGGQAFLNSGIIDPGDLSGITIISNDAFYNTPWKGWDTSDIASPDGTIDNNTEEE